ncbi:MAG TPA: non-homologous end-joining DNA ligase, partial [Marmoricola sp.]|nr:non-homologous end-joining DNA ligase [Marmoricola sp.]
AEVISYYTQVAPVLLPSLADRPVTRVRWPHGTGAPSFFEKNTPGGTPSWVRTMDVDTSGSRTADRTPGVLRFPVVDSLATLVWLSNLAALELHVPQWRAVDGPGYPDRLVIDLDPGEPAGLGECAQVALAVRELLAGLGLSCVPVTSGSEGMHLYASLPPQSQFPLDSGQAAQLAHDIADRLEDQMPALVTATMTKTKRTGKVFFDWSQNVAAKTTIAPYSLRGRGRPYVAAPRTWEEIEQGAADPLALEHLTFPEVLDRLQREGDLFAEQMS